MKTAVQDLPKGKCSILGIGNPLLDISSHVPKEFAEKYGLEPSSAILAEDQHLPIYKDLINNHSPQYIAGGSTQNSIRYASWLLQDTPGSCGFMGCVGKDEYADRLLESGSKVHMNAHYQINEKEPTGTCAVCITNHERTMCTNLAAANCFTEDHLDTPLAKQLLEEAKIVYIASFFCTVSQQSAVRIAKKCAADGKTFIMNLAAEFLIQFFNGQIMELLPFMDIVIANEHEAKCLGKTMHWGNDGEDLIEVAKKLQAMPKETSKPRVVVFTQGKEETLVITSEGVSHYPVIPVAENDLKDVNGAGDSFVGGMLVGLARGEDWDKVMSAAMYCANVCVQHDGCTYPDTPSFSF